MLSDVQRRKINDSEVNYDCFYITNDISVMCVCAIFYGHRNTLTVKSDFVLNVYAQYVTLTVPTVTVKFAHTRHYHSSLVM